MDDIRLLTKIATLYYKGGLTQQKIAARLGISRQTVGRHLKRAEVLGIVKVEIKSQLLYSTDLEYKLEKKFNLSESIVVTPPVDTEEAEKIALGQAGAAFLHRRVQPGDIIGISWSSTVYQCAMQLTPTEPRNVVVVQLNGSLDRTLFSTRAEYIIEKMANALGGSTASLVAPMSVDQPSIRESLLRDSKIAATLELANRTHLALFGVGNISDQSSLYKAGYLDDEMLARLREASAVGEICGHFYDAQGQICVPDYDDCTVAVSLNSLRSKRVAVALAAGLHKVDALLGMLQGGYCNVLITTEETASALLEQVSTRKNCN